jgi:hypothetical protein
MDNLNADLYVAIISADQLPFTVGDSSYFLAFPTRENRLYGEILFEEYYQRAREAGLPDENELLQLLFKHKLWDREREDKLTKLEKDIDDIKVQMFDNYLNGSMIDKMENVLKKSKELLLELSTERMALNNISAASYANYVKNHFLLGCSIYRSKTKPYWKNPQRCWELEDSILPEAYKTANKYFLSENQYRELARSNAWRNIWSVRKGTNVFGRNACDLSVPQRHLLAWSSLYDNIYRSSESPSEYVINNDDLLDGWLIKQKRKTSNKSEAIALQEKINPKIANSSEVFIVAGADEYSPVGKDKFDLIYNMNDPVGKLAFKKRMAQISRDKVVDESSMLETQEQIRMQIASQRSNKK